MTDDYIEAILESLKTKRIIEDAGYTMRRMRNGHACFVAKDE